MKLAAAAAAALLAVELAGWAWLLGQQARINGAVYYGREEKPAVYDRPGGHWVIQDDRMWWESEDGACTYLTDNESAE
jgi:hypothetical protein